MQAPNVQQLTIDFDVTVSADLLNLTVDACMLARHGINLLPADMSNAGAFATVFTPPNGGQVVSYPDESFAVPVVHLGNVSQAADLFLNSGRSTQFRVGPQGAMTLLKALHELRKDGEGGFSDLLDYINAPNCVHGNMLALLHCFVDANLTGRAIGEDRRDYPNTVANTNPGNRTTGLSVQLCAMATLCNPGVFAAVAVDTPLVHEPARAPTDRTGGRHQPHSVQELALMAQLQPTISIENGGTGLSASCCFEVFNSSAQHFDNFRSLRQVMEILVNFVNVFQPPRDRAFARPDYELLEFTNQLRQRKITTADEPMTVLSLAQSSLKSLLPSLQKIQAVVTRDLQNLKRNRQYQKQMEGESDDEERTPKYLKKLLEHLGGKQPRDQKSGNVYDKPQLDHAKGVKSPTKTAQLINDLKKGLMTRLPKTGTMSDDQHHRAAYKALLLVLGDKCAGCNMPRTGPAKTCITAGCSGKTVHAGITQQVAAITKL